MCDIKLLLFLREINCLFIGQPGTPVGNKVIEKTAKTSTASKQMKKLKSLVQVQATGESPRRSKRISVKAGIEMDTSEIR